MGASIYSLIPELRPWCRALLDVAGRAGLQPRLTSTRRSHSEQARLYRQFVSGGHAYPVAPPGTSAHEYGYAFDLVIAGMDPTDFRDLGTVWESWGGIWGGKLKDPIHFEYPGFSSPKGEPTVGNAFYKLADLLLSFVPWLGAAQLVDDLVSLLDGNNDLATFYLHHPAEALRDLVKLL